MKLLPHQSKAKNEIVTILKKKKLCYLNGQTRSGKTLTVLFAAEEYGAKKVIFITKKKAISSIESDFEKAKLTYKLTVINYESVHKIEDKDFDFLIIDEAHSLSKYAKPAKRTKEIKKRFGHLPLILMSGTPCIESYSQYFHQFWISKFSPFKQYKNFYRWADIFVNKKIKRLGTHNIIDYSGAKEKEIDVIINPYTVIMTKPEDEFTEANKNILRIDTPKQIQALCKRLMNDRAIEGKKGYIMAETPAKLQSKVHQMYNGTVIIEKGIYETETVILDDYKVRFIAERFKGKKIAIFYYYKAELEMLQNYFGEEITTCLDEFNNTDKNLALQQSVTEGMNVSAADCLVYFNFGFSGKNFVQSLDRLTIRGRKDNNVYFIFESNGITEKIYNRVSKKEDFNSRQFLKDFNI